MFKVLCINGSLSGHGKTAELLRIAAEGAREAGAEAETMDLRDLDLPVFGTIAVRPEDKISKLRRKVHTAGAYLIASPEYHGSMSGALKNFFDFHYEEFAGKVVGLIASTGGSLGTSALNHMRDCCLYMHCWTLPYNAAAQPIDFDTTGKLTNAKVRDRLQKLGRDAAIYGQMLRDQFSRDVARPAGTAGFAQWHRIHHEDDDEG
ncbi:MAG TPA: NADPH-dependent FMN reductase [Acidobacteriota bacterium]